MSSRNRQGYSCRYCRVNNLTSKDALYDHINNTSTCYTRHYGNRRSRQNRETTSQSNQVEDTSHLNGIDIPTDIESERCVICFENKKVIAGGCGHLCICYNCNIHMCEQREPKCPICRALWINLHRIYI